MDNDCLNSLFGRGSAFNQQRGIKRLRCLGDVFTPCLTDTVFNTEIVTGRVHPHTGRKWPDETAKTNWTKQMRVPILKTSHHTGKDRGERSIVEAVDKVSAALRQKGSNLKVYIASDDSFFRRGEEGHRYASMRFTSRQLINLANKLYDIPREARSAVDITPLGLR